MRKHFIACTAGVGLLLSLVGALGWGINGSLLFLGILLWGLIKFLGSLVHIVTGRPAPFGSYRKLLYILLGGAVGGFILFDLPGIYLFNQWTYQEQIPNPFSNFPLYAIQALGWGAFAIIFYYMYLLLHVALDKEMPLLGLSKREGLSHKVFGYLGIAGALVLAASIIFVIFKPEYGFWLATLGSFGVWFMLENIEVARTGHSLLLSFFKGHIAPLISILIGSLFLGFIFEYLNLISPRQHWVYYNLPFKSFDIAGVSVLLLISWAWMYIFFLSIYSIVYKNENLWK